MAISITNEEKDDAIEKCMRWYIAKTFEKASHTYNPKTVEKQNTDINKNFYEKA